MKLTILNVAYPFAPVGLDAVGGAEQVLSQLDAALVRAGHHSLVIACAGSVTAGTLLTTPHWPGPLNDATRQQAWEHHRLSIERAVREWSVDVVHLHGVDFYEYLPPPDVPTLATLHLPSQSYPKRIFQMERPNTFVHCVSAAQRRNCPASELLLPEIENGVAPELFLGRHAKRRFAVSLGRICPEKGFHLALEAAKQAGIPYFLGGEVFAYYTHQEYYRREILPRLNSRRRFLGPVGFRRKRSLLTAARCLVAPSLVPETSSLVAMEALACGTPVVAFPSGALAELIEDGKTGFLVRTLSEMIQAIEKCAQLSPELCRETARNRFHLAGTIAKYFELYRRLTHTKTEKREVFDGGSAAIETSH